MSSTSEPTNAIEIFYCYAHEDEVLRNELEKQLRILQRQGLIVSWHDRKIYPGEEWTNEIDVHLKTAQLILLLVSPDFMDSDYCYGVEMKRALERHESGEARVIPIILRPVHWEDAPFKKLQVLPTDAEPITNWSNRDKAFLDITKGIRKIVIELLASYKTKEGDAFFILNRYDEALASYEHAILFDHNYVSAYVGKGNTLSSLKRYTEALAAFDEANQLDPNNESILAQKYRILNQLEQSIKVQQQLETQLLNVQQQVDKYKLEIQQLETRQLEDQQELEDYHNRIQQLNNELASLQAENHNLLAQSATTENVLHEFRQRTQQLQTQRLNQYNVALQAELHEFRDRTKQLETQILSVQQQLEAQQLQSQQLEQKNTLLEHKNYELLQDSLTPKEQLKKQVVERQPLSPRSLIQ